MTGERTRLACSFQRPAGNIGQRENVFDGALGRADGATISAKRLFCQNFFPLPDDPRQRAQRTVHNFAARKDFGHV